jgi:hypothetical protein
MMKEGEDAVQSCDISRTQEPDKRLRLFRPRRDQERMGKNYGQRRQKAHAIKALEVLWPIAFLRLHVRYHLIRTSTYTCAEKWTRPCARRRQFRSGAGSLGGARGSDNPSSRFHRSSRFAARRVRTSPVSEQSRADSSPHSAGPMAASWQAAVAGSTDEAFRGTTRFDT